MNYKNRERTGQLNLKEKGTLDFQVHREPSTPTFGIANRCFLAFKKSITQIEYY